jgi:DnaJ homolog subfamily C member 17
MLARYPHLTTPGALQTFMSSTFGPVDGDSIVLSMKSPKKKATAGDKPPPPPKYAIAAVPFKTISDAHAAVCASRRADRGLDEFEITWLDGSEPAVWSWAERMLKSKEKEQRGATTTVPAMPAPAGGARDVGDGAPAVFPANVGNNARGGLPQDSGAQSSPATSNQQFSSFPSSFVRSRILPLLTLLTTQKQPGLSPPPSSTPQFSAPGLDFESAVLMRMRQAERERLEREIREQEASEA